jgi:hypothetical protein
MPLLAVLAAFLLIALPAAAHEEESTSYNFKNAPKGQTMDATEEEKAEAAVEAKGEEEELNVHQKEARERRKITGERSDVYHGDEHKWPSIGRKR